MGRRTGPVARGADTVQRRWLLRALAVAGVSMLALAGAVGRGLSQEAASSVPPQRMVVEAKELIQDNTKNTVTARGNVQIYYKGRTLEADRVVYDRNTSRVFAEGHAKLTEQNGQVSYADQFDLTDDLKQGFIDGLRSETTDKTYLSSPRAELAGDARVYERPTYTACAPCEDPNRAPLWRVRSRKIIHRVDEQNLYFEDVDLEFFGLPIAYLPFLSVPDPSVKRRSGLLNPHITYKSQLGNGFGIPIFWAVAPNIDLTITPTFFTRQGLLTEVEWKHRLENGTYSVRLDGIKPNNRSAFANPPFGASDRTFRGAIASAGEFAINDKWKFGWDGAFLTDRYFLQDFQIYNPLYNNYFFREVSSTAYLTGQAPGSYFDLRAYAFQGLSPRDYQPQIGFVLPMVEYNKVVPLPPEKTYGLGGQLEFDFNLMNTHADAALYDPIQPRTVDSIYGANYVCQFYTPNKLYPAQSQCLLRGIGGDYGRATGQASWTRRFIDPIGEAWTPFAFVRGSGSYVNYDTSRVYPVYNYLSTPLYNAAQGLFAGSDNTARATFLPGVGLDYRYPFFARTPYGSITFEPIAQIIARPDRGLGSNSLINIDSQSLVFDDSNLFTWNKFSGYDRFETGTRLNYGGQATMNFDNGGFINVMAGQSLQVAGRNGFATPDAANVGLSSGLDSRRSDYVGRFAFAPNSVLSFVAKGRFDVNTFAPRRIDLVGSAAFGGLVLTANYANYASQPAIGFDVRRQGLAIGAKYDITSNYFVNANVTFDLSRHLYNNSWLQPQIFVNPNTGQTFAVPQSAYIGNASVFSIAGLNIGAGYHDECTTFTVNYSSNYQPNSYGLPARNQTILVSLQLRTLGQGSFGASLGSTALNDGLTQRQ